ncbi:hypothetical protein [Pseudooceanicola spongiae]|uniref:Uncharacterized protein n=1 Tax=Pseudooceanicola spongiae TaxID=2613965 RepID=A0A7L9WQU6_9RHOB|nr:hypothetical protein [Pseudooceanicola spongiae]QOL82649.1 hypothetical protein F3W81_18585 [Pseudooceanicola spongiae]
MTISDARDAGLDVQLLAADGTTIANSAAKDDANAQISLQLPTGYRWVVLASSKELSGLSPGAAGDIPVDVIKKVHTQSGYVAMIAGPYSLESAEQILREAHGIAADAYLSSGSGFVRIAR